MEGGGVMHPGPFVQMPFRHADAVLVVDMVSQRKSDKLQHVWKMGGLGHGRQQMPGRHFHISAIVQ